MDFKELITNNDFFLLSGDFTFLAILCCACCGKMNCTGLLAFYMGFGFSENG